VINICRITSFISAKYLRYTRLNNSGIFAAYCRAFKIPFFGPILFFPQYLCVYHVHFLVMYMSPCLYRWGLRVRSVVNIPGGGYPHRLRNSYMAVLLGGMMAGFAGSYFTLGSVGRFDEVMTAGRGFIALAAMIFGNWMPFGAFGAGLLFGFADALASKLAILGVRIPSDFLLMAPYIATMVVLAGVVGRSQMPAADGVPKRSV
jgi:simple sugar transport system permease protein